MRRAKVPVPPDGGVFFGGVAVAVEKTQRQKRNDLDHDAIAQQIHACTQRIPGDAGGQGQRDAKTKADQLAD